MTLPGRIHGIFVGWLSGSARATICSVVVDSRRPAHLPRTPAVDLEHIHAAGSH
jgi:hypothetical protein